MPHIIYLYDYIFCLDITQGHFHVFFKNTLSEAFLPVRGRSVPTGISVYSASSLCWALGLLSWSLPVCWAAAEWAADTCLCVIPVPCACAPSVVLQKKLEPVTDLFFDLRDGSKLLALLEVLTDKPSVSSADGRQAAPLSVQGESAECLPHWKYLANDLWPVGWSLLKIFVPKFCSRFFNVI